MNPATSSRRWRERLGRMGAFSWAILGVVLMAAVTRGVWDEQRTYGQTPKTKSEQPAATGAIGEIRALIGELEAQANGQRGQLEKTEASLARARSILGDLERSHAETETPRNAPVSKQRFNPNDPMRDETLSRQALAEKTAWAWPAETATPEACVRQFGAGYEVEISEAKDASSTPMIQIRKDGRDIVAWPAHMASVFLRAGDVLYYAEFSPHSSGCSIVAYHLRHGETWKTPLFGLGPLGQSMYTNRVNMKLDGNHLIVYGDESAGQYIELVDVLTGRIVGKRSGASLKVRSLNAR